MIRIKIYEKECKSLWDDFIDNSKNSVFLFYRDYMEYHSNRFSDFSLMIYDEDELISLLPANVQNNTLFSHSGLTFGSFITNKDMKISKMLDIFCELKNFLKSNSIENVIYKCIPYIYHSIPAEEDRYALFINESKLIRRDISSCIYLPERIDFQGVRRRYIKKANRTNIIVNKTDDFKSYWKILEMNLKKNHNVKPVHSISEIKYLHSKFPNNIKLFASYNKDIMLAGVVIYESKNVSHAQYIASSEEAKKIGSLDLIFEFLINDYYADKKYFDFGISTEDNGLYLNKGLIFFKEGFGARAIVHDFYEMKIS